MTQTEIIEVLEKAKRPMSRKEIAIEANLNKCVASHNIARMIKNRTLKIIEIDRIEAMERFNCKRRMRLYYI